MGQCRFCGLQARTVSNVIGYCRDCIQQHFEEVWPDIKRLHDASRMPYGLPADPPRAAAGINCSLCLHRCRIPEGGSGYCGLRRVEKGKLKGGRPHEGNLSFYHDPLPTNCVASFVCAAGTGAGYPRYTACRGAEYGYKNLAVFYHACSFNCLYCQNYHFKEHTFSSCRITARELARAADQKTTCICYFGGDPTPHILHALKAASLALNCAPGSILRICWETNGAMQEPFLGMMARLSLQSGGCIKFDLKAWHPAIHQALCGVGNRKTLENFQKLSSLISQRPEPPLLIASTLLVPGYVDEREVSGIAGFLSRLDPEIPYSLLAFYPHFYLDDLPSTSRTHAQRCKQAAEAAGLERVHLGNIHLLGSDY